MTTIRSRTMGWNMLPVMLMLTACDRPPTEMELQHLHAVEPAWPVASFELIKHNGAAFSSAQLHDRWTVLFSGFTHCPDICPATLATLHAAEQQLAGRRHHQTIFVSVDPQRDTPESLQAYLAMFNPDWIGLTGSPDQLDRLLDSANMAHVRIPAGNGEYTMDHATAVILIDPSARVIGYWKAPLDAGRLAQDLGALPRP